MEEFKLIDLSRVEGRSMRIFWALLFSDILLFTKINRDKVVFITEEPLPLANIVDTQFTVKKKGNCEYLVRRVFYLKIL